MWVIAANELRRRVRDRSMVISCLIAPLALAAILGFAFGHAPPKGRLTIGVAGASPGLVVAAAHATQLPADVAVRVVPRANAVREEVADGRLAGGVILSADGRELSNLLIPIVAPGAAHSPGFDVVSRASSLTGQEWAESIAAGLASRLYAGNLRPGSAPRLASISVHTESLGNAGRGVLDYFAPSIAVVFLFIGGGLGMRSLMLERSAGTLVRIAAAPVRPTRIVAGKMAAIFITGLSSILVVWGATTFIFGADWGAPLGVLLLSIGATAAMCGLGTFLTSLARNEQEAFGVALIVGLLLSLVGGNLLPPGSLPEVLQIASLGTPNGWALVGFGRLSLLHGSAGSVVGPFLVLFLIAAVTFGLAATRVRRMVAP
jgi:ABC-2 type transport system permease protein